MCTGKSICHDMVAAVLIPVEVVIVLVAVVVIVEFPVITINMEACNTILGENSCYYGVGGCYLGEIDLSGGMQ